MLANKFLLVYMRMKQKKFCLKKKSKWPTTNLFVTPKNETLNSPIDQFTNLNSWIGEFVVSFFWCHEQVVQKSLFSKTANSPFFFVKISWIGPWLSRIDWCKYFSLSTYIAVRQSEMPSNSKGENFVWKIYWNFPLNLGYPKSEGITCKIFWW